MEVISALLVLLGVSQLWDFTVSCIAEDYPLYLNDEELGNKETKTNCTIEIYGQPYNEICDETKLADISVSPFDQ